MFILHIHTKHGVGSAAYEWLGSADRSKNTVRLRHRGTGELSIVDRRTVEKWLCSKVARLEMISGCRRRVVES